MAKPCEHAHVGPFSAGCSIDVWRCDACGERVTTIEAKRTFAIKRRIVELELNALEVNEDRKY
jgi:hypothetical protein